MKDGLKRGTRHHVHLTENIEIAKAVGSRRGKPIVLAIKAKAMYEAAFDFFLTENNVWLTHEVPPAFISLD